MFDRLPPIVRTILPRLLSVRVAVLVLLCVQNSSHVLLIRASRGERGERYITSTNVLITEIVKMRIFDFSLFFRSTFLLFFFFLFLFLYLFLLSVVCVFVIAKDHKDKEGLFNHLQVYFHFFHFQFTLFSAELDRHICKGVRPCIPVFLAEHSRIYCSSKLTSILNLLSIC